MASGDETFFTETAPPVLQNLGREMSWIDATAEAAMMNDLEIGCDELIERDLRAGLRAHIPVLGSWSWHLHDHSCASYSTSALEDRLLFVNDGFARRSIPWCSSAGGVLMRLPAKSFGVDTAR